MNRPGNRAQALHNTLTQPPIALLLHANIHAHVRRRPIRVPGRLIVDTPVPGDLAVCVLRLLLRAPGHGRRTVTPIHICARRALCQRAGRGAEDVEQAVADPGWVGAVGAEAYFDGVDAAGAVE